MKQGGPLLLLLACHLQATNPLTSSSKSRSCDKRRESRDSIPTSSQREVTQPLWQSNEKAQLEMEKHNSVQNLQKLTNKKNCNI